MKSGIGWYGSCEVGWLLGLDSAWVVPGMMGLVQTRMALRGDKGAVEGQGVSTFLFGILDDWSMVWMDVWNDRQEASERGQDSRLFFHI